MSALRMRAALIGVAALVGSVFAALPGTAAAAGDHVAVCSSTNLLGPVFTTEQDTNWFVKNPSTAAYPYSFVANANLPVAIPTAKLGNVPALPPFGILVGKYTLVCNPTGLTGLAVKATGSYVDNNGEPIPAIAPWVDAGKPIPGVHPVYDV